MSLMSVKGQGPAVKKLLAAAARKRSASSYLFAGEEGVGKRFTALNLIKALNCLDPQKLEGGFTDACDLCPSCRKFDSGMHPDFVSLEPDGGIIKVDRIRDLEEVLALRPYEAKVKAALVDDADTMNMNAANAFLKTLEEPPPQSLIVLVSSRPDRLPETIRSRCSRVNFRPLPAGECEAVIGAGGKSAVLARLSMGRPGLALREDLSKKRDRFLSSLRKMLHEEGKPTWKDRQDIEQWLETALMFLRDMAVLKVTGEAEALVNRDIATEMEAMSGGAELKGILECYEKLRTLRGRLLFNLNKGITWNYTRSLFEELNI